MNIVQGMESDFMNKPSFFHIKKHNLLAIAWIMNKIARSVAFYWLPTEQSFFIL